MVFQSIIHFAAQKAEGRVVADLLARSIRLLVVLQSRSNALVEARLLIVTITKRCRLQPDDQTWANATETGMDVQAYRQIVALRSCAEAGLTAVCTVMAAVVAVASVIRC